MDEAYEQNWFFEQPIIEQIRFYNEAYEIVSDQIQRLLQEELDKFNYFDLMGDRIKNN